MRRMLAAAVLLGALALTSGPAHAQYPPEEGDAVVSDTTVVPGQPITVSGSGWLPGSRVTIDFFSSAQRLGTARVAADGTFSTEVTIPENATPGRHTLVISGTAEDGQPAQEEIVLQVVGERGEAGVAFTGANITVGLVILIGLVVAGGAAIAAGRARGRTAD